MHLPPRKITSRKAGGGRGFLLSAGHERLQGRVGREMKGVWMELKEGGDVVVGVLSRRLRASLIAFIFWVFSTTYLPTCLIALPPSFSLAYGLLILGLHTTLAPFSSPQFHVYAPHTYIHTIDLTHPPRMHIYYYERPLAPCILSLCWIRRVPTHTILLMIFCRVRRRILLVCHGTYSTLGLSAEIAGWSRPSIFTWSHSEGSTIFTSRRVIQSGSELPEYVSLLVLVNLRASTI